MLAEYHADNIENPDDIPAEYDTQNARYNLAVHKSGDESAHPAGNRDNCKNDTDDVAKTEIIAFAVCHDFFTLLLILLSVYPIILSLRTFIKVF